MAKIKISSADLAHIFSERLGTFHDFPGHAVVAIVPDPISGWVAIASKKTKPIPIERFKEVERSLRRKYELKED